MDTLGDSYILIPQDFGMIPKIQKVGQVTNWSRKYVFLWPFRVFGHGLYTKKKFLQYLDIVGVVFSLSGFVQLLGDPPGIFTLWLYVFETQMLSKLLKSYRNDLVTISKMLICLLMTPLCLLNFPGSKLQLSF